MSKRFDSVSERDGPRREVLSVPRRRTGLPSSPFLEHSRDSEQTLTLPTHTDVWPSLRGAPEQLRSRGDLGKWDRAAIERA